MEQKVIKKILQVDGMSCAGCEMRIENKLAGLDGVVRVKAVFTSSNVYVTYDANSVTLGEIVEEIEKLHYSVKNKPDTIAAVDGIRKDEQSKGTKAFKDKKSISRMLGLGIILLAVYLVAKNMVGFNFIPEVNQSMGYGLLFAAGLLTSLHCVAMCGGISLTQCVSCQTSSSGRFSRLKPSFLYNAGRVVSYTVIGGVAGALGSVVSFSGPAKGIVAILAGILMVIVGLNMLNFFPWLRMLNPRMPKLFGNKLYNKNNGTYGPFIVGLLNGFMPCGPLQSMQIYALGTGSAAAGAISMLLFSLGTVPLMFGFGALSTFISGKFTHKMLKVSAVLVIALGFITTSRGLALSGITVPDPSSAGRSNVAVIKGDVQVVTTSLEAGRYTPIIVQRGIPVKWTIRAKASDLNGCNNPIYIPQFNQQYQISPGDNIIEFTPVEEGNIPYSCWMGMIRSNIMVVSDLSAVTEEEIDD